MNVQLLTYKTSRIKSLINNRSTSYMKHKSEKMDFTITEQDS